MHRYALTIAACLILVGAVDVLVGGVGLRPEPAPLELDEGAKPDARPRDGGDDDVSAAAPVVPGEYGDDD